MPDLKRPFRIDSRRLFPLSKTLWGMACAVCDKTQARWQLVTEVATETTEEQSVPICAMCFLYETEWGKHRAEDLAGYLDEVMKSNPTRKMLLSPDNKLLSAADADFILGILALTSRQFEMDDQRREGREGQTNETDGN